MPAIVARTGVGGPGERTRHEAGDATGAAVELDAAAVEHQVLEHVRAFATTRPEDVRVALAVEP
jgi:hypothetical protein